MKKTLRRLVVPVALCSVIIAGCSDDDDNDSGVMDPGTMPATEFSFSEQSPSEYTRIDRAGMPAIATALINSKDAYNQANPAEDIDLTNNPFVSEILNSLTFLHNALDGQLTDLGLTPCTVVGDATGTCAATAVPLIIPDTLTLDTSTPAGFPNGRLLSDPVIDVTLAVALLELTGDPAPHTATALVGVLNPPANDLTFSDEFPFLAEPHQ